MSPSLEPHADRHAKLAALLEAHVADDFNVALDMLTRTSETTDIAPNASVYPRARTAAGGRQLEQLAFEIAVTETLSHAARKAAKLTGRGVRRVFAIEVERGRAFEWSPALGTWTMIDAAASIEDRALAVALPVESLVVTGALTPSALAALRSNSEAARQTARCQELQHPEEP